jgi:hypothetical protein
MMSLDYIEQLNDEAAVAAAQKGLYPYIPYDLDEVLETDTIFRSIPNIGSLDISDEWEEIETVLVDSSGLGAEYEPALTIGQFRDFVSDHVRQSSRRGFAIVSQGQFQVVVGVFERL